MRKITTLFAAASLVVGLCGEHALAQASKPKGLRVQDLPASVQATIQETLKGGVVKNITKEKEDGIEQYEIESTLNGKSRDFNVAADGRLLVVEETTTLDEIPAPARAAIQKKVGGGTVKTVETFAQPASPSCMRSPTRTREGKGTKCSSTPMAIRSRSDVCLIKIASAYSKAIAEPFAL
jgi:hypothetical protein